MRWLKDNVILPSASRSSKSSLPFRISDIFIVKHEGEKQLGRPRRRREDNIRLDLSEIGWKLSTGLGLGRDFLDTVMNLKVPEKAGNLMTS